MNNGPLIIDCPVCKRTIWAHATCWHGQPPPRLKLQDEEVYDVQESDVIKDKSKGKDKGKPK